MKPPLRVEALSSDHDRAGFACDVPALDRYIREQATQDIRRRISNCFAATPDGAEIAGYYTFAAASLPMTDLPEDMTRRLPRYGHAPAVLIGRLAVARGWQKKGLGGALLMDAAARAGRSDPAIFTLVVDAKDEAAAAFYVGRGYRPLASRPMSLFMPVSTALAALN